MNDENMDLVNVMAQGFISRFGIDCGLRLDAIAPELGLTVQEVDADSFDGALLRIVGRPIGTIAINRNIREEGRKRFTLAHEIGHYIMPNQINCCGPCRSKEIESWSKKLETFELQANRFAGEILMPRERFSALLRVEPTFPAVKEIASICRTSLTAACYRFVDLSSFRVAVVWSTRGRVAWYKTSTEFGRAIPREILDARTYAYDCFKLKPVPDRFERVPASAWLYEYNLKDDATLLEHSLFLPFYESVLTLLYLKEPVEDVAENEDPCAELDPHEFTLQRRKWPRKH